MNSTGIPFQITDWQTIPIAEHKGDTGIPLLFLSFFLKSNAGELKFLLRFPGKMPSTQT